MTTAPEAGARRRGPSRRARLTATISIGALVLGAGGYTLACALAPLPAPEFRAAENAERTAAVDPATAQAVADAQALPAAVGWAADEEVWANDDRAYPIASISKVVTVLASLERQPLEPGADGPVHVWTEADAARTEEYLAADGIAYAIPVGTEVTTRQMLTLALLPSANDFAAAYAMSVWGDEESFRAGVADWAARNGLESLRLVEPTGMDEQNVATAADLVRLGRLAAANPTLTEFTGLEQAELPWGIGLVENTNPLLGRTDGVVGLKTGRSSSAGYNLLILQRAEAGDRDGSRITAVLGRDSDAARARDSRDLLVGLADLPQRVDLVAADERIGTATTVDGAEIPLLTAEGAGGVLLPGETATATTELGHVGALAEGPKGQRAGVMRVELPTGAVEIPVVTGSAIVEPDLWWRMTHPGELFGG